MATEEQLNHPLHGVSLERILTVLLERHGWEGLWTRMPVRCFQMNQSVKSSLTFLRKTPWARKELEDWYVSDLNRPPRVKF
ncbi:MAG: VF530 family protein [Pseudomonadota bacterium]|nr:VF530 family protein [Pseudomonadota bacterium]